MLLAAPEIARRLSTGARQTSVDDLVIRPLPDVQALMAGSAASVDLRLGCWFTTMRQSRVPLLHVDDDAARIAAKIGISVSQMEAIQDYVPSVLAANEGNVAKTNYVPFGRPFVLHPNNFVLGVT